MPLSSPICGDRAGLVSDEMVLAIDFMPTIAELIDAPPGPYPFDGKNLMPVVDGGATPHEAFFFFRGRALEAVRSGPWKLHVPHRYRSIHGAKLVTATHPGVYRQDSTDLALYDLSVDPGEAHNLAESHPDIVARLMALMDEARIDLGDSQTQTQGKSVRPASRINSDTP